MTKQITLTEAARVRSLAEAWLGRIDGELPIVVALTPYTPVVAVAFDPNTGLASHYDLGSGLGMGTGPLSGAIALAAAVQSRCMAGCVWDEVIAVLNLDNPEVLLTLDVLTREYAKGMDPADGLTVARQMMGI